MSDPVRASDNFIHEIIAADAQDGRTKEVVTRFPPEPNGYLHIGHAKAIALNFEMAREFGGRCHLRMDDTNPERESEEYISSIIEDVRWLGYQWDGAVRYASDYFDALYKYAVQLIEAGLAYVDTTPPDTMRKERGTPTEAGIDSACRGQSVAENMRLFEDMRAGQLDEGECVLRAKIDMRHPNLVMRDPTLYRIRRQAHARCGDRWSIYPLYDFAHGQSDAIEGITHSLCTLEFENHRPLYEWFLEALGFQHRPKQIEFARLNLSHTVLSKRLLQELVDARVVTGWDDPRMPTLRGLRRRGCPPQAIRAFCRDVGITKVESIIDYAHFEYFLRHTLNKIAHRVMVVLRPLLLIIENYPEGREEEVQAHNNPEDSSAGERTLLFGRELYIEQDDFMREPPRGYFRLSPGAEVRLQHAYYVTCRQVEYNADNSIRAIICTYDPASRGGRTTDGRKVRGTLQWVNRSHAVPLTAHLYDRLLRVGDAGEEMRGGARLIDLINPQSVARVQDAVGEPMLASPDPNQYYQFIRHGYFVHDAIDSRHYRRPCFNRTVALRDSWQRMQGGTAHR